MIRITSPHPRRKARIEIIPLIDIVFFLLATFVMVSLSMVKNQGLIVKLPQSRMSAAVDRNDTVTLTVTGDGSYYLGKERVLAGDIQERLTRLHRESPETSVIVNGDDTADFGAAVRALDEIRGAGISKVSIQTERPKS